jgi:hypothetical protein
VTRTPDVVLDDLRMVRGGISRGPDKLYDAEVNAETLELAAQKAEDVAFFMNEGSVDARKAAARLAAEAELTAAVVARAEYNRVRAKIKALELEQMSLQTELKYMVGEGA